MRPVTAILLAAVVAAGCSAGKSGPSTEERIRALEQEVERQRGEKAAYTPEVEGRIDDLGMPAVELLRQLPGVAGVEVLVSPRNPTHRIIHLRDWHYVPPDLFALDVRQRWGSPSPTRRWTPSTGNRFWKSSWFSRSRPPSSAAWSSTTACTGSWPRG